MDLKTATHSVQERITPLYIGEKERGMAVTGGVLFLLAGIKGFKDSPVYATMRIIGGSCLIAIGVMGYLPLIKGVEKTPGVEDDSSEPGGM